MLLCTELRVIKSRLSYQLLSALSQVTDPRDTMRIVSHLTPGSIASLRPSSRALIQGLLQRKAARVRSIRRGAAAPRRYKEVNPSTPAIPTC